MTESPAADGESTRYCLLGNGTFVGYDSEDYEVFDRIGGAGARIRKLQKNGYLTQFYTEHTVEMSSDGMSWIDRDFHALFEEMSALEV